MIAISLFWFALCTILLFLCSMCLKAIAWIFEGCVSALKDTLKIGFIGGLVIAGLLLINFMVLTIQKEAFQKIMFPLIIACVAIIVLVTIFKEAGPEIYDLITDLLGAIFGIVSGLFLMLGDYCENGYRYFLDQMLEKLKRC